MSTQRLKLIKTDSEFIETAGQMVEVNGTKYYHLPYWYKKIGDELYEEMKFGDLPKDLKDYIVGERNECDNH